MIEAHVKLVSALEISEKTLHTAHPLPVIFVAVRRLLACPHLASRSELIRWASRRPTPVGAEAQSPVLKTGTPQFLGGYWQVV